MSTVVDYEPCRVDEGVMAETITVKEAAADAKITRYAVWVAIKRGKLSAEKRGRDWHITRSEWERYKATSLRPRTIDAGSDTGKEARAGSDEVDVGQQDGK
jgi:hypothetical protein